MTATICRSKSIIVVHSAFMRHRFIRYPTLLAAETKKVIVNGDQVNRKKDGRLLYHHLHQGGNHPG